MTAPTVLVTGGAGYIGAHTCLALAAAGFTPVTYDNLSNGHAAFVQWGPLEVGDIRDGARLAEVFARWRPVAVIHFAGLIEVGDSMKRPLDFYAVNVGGAVSVLNAMLGAGVSRFVLSSTCAIYGEPVQTPINESHPQAPINPYGRSKLMTEHILRDLNALNGLGFMALRYFNASGADPEGRIGERHDPETHALPLAIFAAIGRRQGFSIFGEDYPTRDGSAVRDYVHVLDLADAHVRALRALLDGSPSNAFNLGTGTGTSVKELIAAVEAVAGKPLGATSAPRRAGDAPALVADNQKARTGLGWSPTYSFEDSVRTAFAWHAVHEPKLRTTA